MCGIMTQPNADSLQPSVCTPQILFCGLIGQIRGNREKRAKGKEAENSEGDKKIYIYSPEEVDERGQKKDKRPLEGLNSG